MSQYNLDDENPDNNDVSEYLPMVRKESAFQSESALEKSLIGLRRMQYFFYVTFTTE